MDQQELRAYLETLRVSLTDEDHRILSARLESLVSVFPFNEYEYILSFLLDRRVISFAEYEELRNGYVLHNPYLGLFGWSPRVFGQVWGEKHLMELDSRFVKPTRSLDPDYDRQYDLLLDAVKIEVKASRAVHRYAKSEELSSRALWYGFNDPFLMNFQQLKIDICDVFIFIGVWVDRILYWVLSNKEVEEQPTRSRQHRGGIEYQIGITNRNIDQFRRFLVDANSLADTVLIKGRAA